MSYDTDTDPEVQMKLDKLMASLTLEERANRFFQLWEANRSLLFEGIKLRNPEASPSDCIKLFNKYLESTWT